MFLSPQGRKLDQRIVSELAFFKELILICGRYEGVDQRVIDSHVDYEISIGDFILTGGELPAMVLIDAAARLLPGVLGNARSLTTDTFSSGLLKYPQYTRPRCFQGMKVPEVLVSGNHSKIERWRIETSLLSTLSKRKDLFFKKKLSSKEIKILFRWHSNIEKIIQEQFVSSIDSLSSS